MSNLKARLANMPPAQRRDTLEMPIYLANAREAKRLQSLLTNFDFIDAKISYKEFGVQALITDYDLALQPDIEIAEEIKENLKLIQGALILSANALADDKNQLAGQLMGRLQHFATPEIKTLLTQAKQKEAPILYPLTASLLPPGIAVARTLTGHQSTTDSSIGNVSAVAIAETPERTWIVSGSWDHTVKVWDLRTGQELRTLRGHNTSVLSVAVTPDGKKVISGSADNTIKVWDLETGQQLLNLTEHKERVNALAVTPDGKKIVSGAGKSTLLGGASSDNTIKIWDLETGQELFTLDGHTAIINAVAVTPDGRKVISASGDASLKIWDLQTREQLHTLTGHKGIYDFHKGEINDVAIASDGKQAISASSDDQSLIIWDLESGEKLQSLKVTAGIHGQGVVALTPDGKLAVSGCDKSILVWDLTDEARPRYRTLGEHTGDITAVAVTSDGKWGVSASQDNTLKIWDLENKRKSPILPGHKSLVKVMAVTPDGTKALSVGHKDIKVWDLHIGRELFTLEGVDVELVSPLNKIITFTPDHQRVIATSFHGIKVWNLCNGEELLSLRGHKDDVFAVAIAPDGKKAISASQDKSLKVWDLQSGVEVMSLIGHSEIVVSVAITPDGKQVVSASWDKTLKVWDLESGKEWRTLIGHTEVIWDLAISPDGKKVVSYGKDSIKVWDLQLGSELLTLKGYGKLNNFISLYPDGTGVVCLLDRNTLQVWDLQSGSKLLTLAGHTNSVQSLAITPNNKYAVSASSDRSLRVWDLQTGDAIARFNGDSAINYCAVSPDGITIVAGEESGRVHFLRFKMDNSDILSEQDWILGELQKSEEFLIQGRELLDSGEYEEAIKIFDRAIQLNPNLYEAWWDRGTALSRLEFYFEANQSFCKASDIIGLNHEDFDIISMDAIGAKYALARQEYNKIVDCITSGREIDIQNAINNLTKILKINKDFAKAYCLRGDFRNKVGEYQGAIEDLTKGIELSPELANTYNPVLAKAYYRRGVYFHKSEEYQKATEDYENAIRIEPNTRLAKVYTDLLAFASNCLPLKS
ncbi:MAG: WD40 repeat domain-containing protein [Microcoleus sp.]